MKKHFCLGDFRGEQLAYNYFVAVFSFLFKGEKLAFSSSCPRKKEAILRPCYHAIGCTVIGHFIYLLNFFFFCAKMIAYLYSSPRKETNMSLKVTVIGCGRWGSFIANYLASHGHDVTLYGPKGAPDIEQFIETRKSDLITLCDELKLSTSLGESLKDKDVIIISIPSQRLRGLLGEMREHGFTSGRITLCMKGLEIETGKRLTEIVKDEMGDRVESAVWIGPGHVQEFTRGVPNCMVIDSESEEMKKLLVGEFSSEVIRFYYGTDLIGNEIGAAAKNVVGIAAGMLDGMGLSSLKGALMSRGTREVARLIGALGGNQLSAYGLCHLGDYEATVFSKFSHNRHFGEAFIKGEKFDKLAEGYYTVRALTTLADKLGVEMPISRVVEDVLYHGRNPKEALTSLFERALKSEF